LLIVTGKYQVRPPLPFIPGSEVAGVVTEVGPGVKNMRIGDRVAGLNFTFAGGLAEEAIMPASMAVPVPDAVPLRIAAAMLVNYATALYGLRDRGNVRPGERVLVLGAAGGVGLATVEIAKAMGAHVVAAASSEEKLALAKQHGAVECINYTAVSLKDELKASGGIDVVMDPVGGAYSEPALRCLRPGGRLIVVGFAAGEIPRIALNLVLLKDCAIVGAFLSTQARTRPADLVSNIADLYEMFLQGELNPVVRELECFSDYESAMQQIADREVIGKVTLSVGSHLEKPVVAEGHRAIAAHAAFAEETVASAL
jgi:NADPH:quinone reductase-like Zn-dependent oxidoreductase